jgi:hypothetical protein
MRPPHMYFIWRDHVGIEPTGDGTRLPKGFEVRVVPIPLNHPDKSTYNHADH